MRSWTTFAIFGAFLLVLVISSAIGKVSAPHHPVIRAAETFFTAIKHNDAAAVENLTDGNAVKVMKAGNSIINVSFKEANAFDGPFVRNEATSLGYMELTGLAVDVTKAPHVYENSGMASVTLKNGTSMYLRRFGKTWKVFYITK